MSPDIHQSRDVQAELDAHLPLDGRPFALAFSGGGDSLALLNRLKAHPRLKTVLHVDHGLRDASELEAMTAAALAKVLGHELVVLRWVPDGSTSGLQEKARRARYGLMGDYCRNHAIDTLVTAHHADDQAETVLMRVKRVSGWRGAAGMRVSRYAPVWPELAGVTLCRPMLDVSRVRLRESLGPLDPIEDVSNVDTRFTRVQVRQELARSPALKTDMLNLASAMTEGVAVETDRIKAELDGYHLTHEGLLSIPRLLSAPALALIAPIVGGQSGPADRSRIAEKLAPLESGDHISIGQGCMGQWDGEILTLCRDLVALTGRRDRRISPTAVPIAITEKPTIWDGRFLVSGSGGQLHPERRGNHVGFRIHYGQNVQVKNLVQDRLQAALTGS